MKKILLFLVSLLMAMSASASFNVGSLVFNQLASGEVEVVGFTSTALAQNPTSVYIPGRVTMLGTEYKVYSIAANAFKSCTSLRYVYVDWGIVEIGHDAFYGCTNLYSVRLPSTITVIDTYAFGSCSSMTVFGIAATTPPFAASSAFDGMKKCNVHVATEAARTTYNASSVWTRIDTDGNVARTPNLAHDFSASNRYYLIHTARTVSSYSARATLIGVDGNVTYVAISSVTDNLPVTYGNCSSGYTANVTRIAPYACQGNTNITSVGRSDLGSETGFESVGASAFQGCTSLTFVGIPRGVIDAEAFKGCTALSSVQLYSTRDMDNGVYSLGANAFNGCTNLHELLLHNTNNAITLGNKAFGNNASDFKCYVPIKGFYTVWKNVYDNWGSNPAAQLHPCIVPKTEWTAISCHRPLLLPSTAQFYYVPDFTVSGNNIIANKQQVIGSIASLKGLLMKATPGTLYRFTTLSNGAGTVPTSNHLIGISGESTVEATNNFGPDGTLISISYLFNPASKVFEKNLVFTTLYSGEAVLRYPSESINTIAKIYLQGETEPCNLVINGQDVTTSNCGDLTVLNGVSGTQVKFDPSTRTLTLNNATINGTVSTQYQDLTISVNGINTISGSLWLECGTPQKSATITGGGALNLQQPLYSDYNLTIKGNTKVFITGATASSASSIDYAIDATSKSSRNHAYLTLEGSGTELRLTSTKHLLRSTLTLNDGLYIAQPKCVSFQTFGWSTVGGMLVDAYGEELYNTEVVINAASPRGFKHGGLWYETNTGSNITLIAPQRGENYTGSVVIPSAFQYNSRVLVVNAIEPDAFTGTGATSVEVASTVTSIGQNAFYGAKNLKSLEILTDKRPNQFTLLGENFVGNNASGFACYVPNHWLLTWTQTYSSINILPWVMTLDNGFLTFSCARHITLPEGLSAYRVSGFDMGRRMATTIKLTNSRIPSKNGVILQGEPGTRYLMQASATTPSALGNNMLRPLLTVDDIPYAPLAANPDDTKAYFLGNSCEQWIEFVNNIDLFMSINTGIAYLAVSKSLLGGDYTSPVQLDLWYTPEGVRGDVNDSGAVDVDDLNIIINIMLGKDSADNYGNRADIDDSSSVDVSDMNEVINIMLGKE